MCATIKQHLNAECKISVILINDKIFAYKENDKYYIASNRESGNGRFDIQLMPRVSSLPGFLIEVKAAKHYSLDKLEELSQIALEQITKQKYDTDMRAKGVSKVFKFGIAFSGKDVKIAVS